MHGPRGLFSGTLFSVCVLRGRQRRAVQQDLASAQPLSALTSPLGEVPPSSAVSSVAALAALGTPALPPSWQGRCAESDCGQGVKSARFE